MPASQQQGSPVLRIQVARELTAVRRAAVQFRSFLAAHRIPEEELWACELAFVEACNNAVQHGGAADVEPIAIEISLCACELEIRILDRDAGFAFPDKIALPDPEEERGRGLYLIRSLMDQVVCERAGADAMNCLILRKSLVGI